MRKFCVTVVGILVGWHMVGADAWGSVPSETVFSAANEAFRTGDYEKAIALYHEVISDVGPLGIVYYNIGNAHYRLGHLGKAIANFRRAERLMPRNEDLQANLKYARDKTRDRIAVSDTERLKKKLLFWHVSLNAQESLWVALILNFVFWGGLTLRLMGWRRVSLGILVGIEIITLVFAGSWVSKIYFSTPLAVVVEPSISVHSGGSDSHTILFNLHEGAEAEIVDSQAGWLKIVLSDGKKGWVNQLGVDVVN